MVDTLTCASDNLSEVRDDDKDASAAADATVGIEEHGQERVTLARKENAAVIWMKSIAFLVLLFTCILVSTGVFAYTRNDQWKDFETVFQADAAKLLESFHVSVKRTLEAVDALGVSITSHAMQTNSTFPFVTLPDVSARFANTRILSGSVYVEYLALVQENDRSRWEDYFIKNRHAYDEALVAETVMRQRQDAEFADKSHGRALDADPPAFMMEFNNELQIMTPDGRMVPAPPQSGPYLALYQTSPTTLMRAILNFNSLSHPNFAGAYGETISTAQATLSGASNLKGEHLGPTGAVFMAMLANGQYRHSQSSWMNGPVSNFGYPVFDTLDLATRQVVGVIGTSFYWKLYLQNVLPPNTRGLHCVFENTMGQTFTYLVSGNEVTYLGDDDFHDRQFDYLEESSDVATYLAQILSAETKSYTSVGLNDYCSYTLRIYPSEETRDQYVNADPVIIAGVIVLVFTFTSLVFVVYTLAVGRRQQVVMDRAVASSAIVSSLFPSQVRDQIYRENEVSQKPKEFAITQPELEARMTRPIAELFDATTILFADLVGFTEWSSKRQPVQVFELLETLYQAFDEIAVRRKVFKVETIGDCYVAATGLPTPQSDHAIIMVRFASDCISQMNQLTAELAVTLGADTASLAMRVGLHSGPVTGGVLRGQKSRFQLSGDTMNTASRLESNGARGRIHVSQETADALVAKGKSSWVTPREDKIVAKGKGELQSYWVSPRSMARSHAGSSALSFSNDEFDA